MPRRKSTNYNIAWRNSLPFNLHRILPIRIKFRCLKLNGRVPCREDSQPVGKHLSFVPRQNQANELLRVQQSSIEREHHLAENFREKISTLKQEIRQIKRIYDDRVVELNHEHEELLVRLRDEHQLEIENIKKELQALFHIENEAQTKFYLQTIEELKHEHQDLLSKQINQHELGEEFLQEKQRLEEQIQSLRNQIEQIETRSQLALEEQENLLDKKANEYQQLHDDFEQYKSIFNTKSSNLNELNEQVSEEFHEQANRMNVC